MGEPPHQEGMEREASASHVKITVKAAAAEPKWFYLIGITGTTVLSWVLRDYSGEWLALNARSFQLCQGSEDPQACGSQQVVMRISFATFCFFCLLGALVLGLGWGLEGDEDRLRVDVHGSLWLWKALLWGGSVIGFFFIPSSAVIGYAQFARMGSAAFLVVALFQILDLAYRGSEWLAAEARVTPGIRALEVLLCVLLFSLGLTLLALCYHFFAPSGASCSLNLWFITWSLLLMLALAGALCLPSRRAGGGAAAATAAAAYAPSRRPSLVTSGTVFLYTSILLVSALGSEPQEHECYGRGWTDQKWMQVVMFITQLAIVVFSVLAASSDPDGPREDAQGQPLFPPYRAEFFHLVYALAALYIGILMSKWQVSPSDTEFRLDEGWASTWIKMAAKWACELLYLLTVAAPALCSGGTLLLRCDFTRLRLQQLPRPEQQLEPLQRPSVQLSDRQEAAPPPPAGRARGKRPSETKSPPAADAPAAAAARDQAQPRRHAHMHANAHDAGPSYSPAPPPDQDPYPPFYPPYQAPPAPQYDTRFPLFPRAKPDRGPQPPPAPMPAPAPPYDPRHYSHAAPAPAPVPASAPACPPQHPHGAHYPGGPPEHPLAERHIHSHSHYPGQAQGY